MPLLVGDGAGNSVSTVEMLRSEEDVVEERSIRRGIWRQMSYSMLHIFEEEMLSIFVSLCALRLDASTEESSKRATAFNSETYSISRKLR